MQGIININELETERIINWINWIVDFIENDQNCQIHRQTDNKEKTEIEKKKEGRQKKTPIRGRTVWKQIGIIQKIIKEYLKIILK